MPISWERILHRFVIVLSRLILRFLRANLPQKSPKRLLQKSNPNILKPQRFSQRAQGDQEKTKRILHVISNGASLSNGSFQAAKWARVRRIDPLSGKDVLLIVHGSSGSSFVSHSWACLRNPLLSSPRVCPGFLTNPSRRTRACSQEGHKRIQDADASWSFFQEVSDG